MYSFKELKKARQLDIQGKQYKLAVLGNCATQFLAMSILGCAKLEQINLEVFDADYNQIDAQLLNPVSETYNFKPDYILLYIASEKIYEEFMQTELSLRDDFADNMMNKIQHYWSLISNYSEAKILQMNFVEINDKILGNYSAKIQSAFIYQIRKLNYLLQEAMSKRDNVYPVDLLALQIQQGTNQLFNQALYYSSKVTIDLDALPYVASAVVDILKAMQGKIKKCVILDLDNTLWGGVIGDDGVAGIEIGEYGRGHAFTDFQLWLRQLKDRGILLAVCSKNDETVAKEPFEKNDEMVLKLSDFSVFVANWQDKASNIKWIQKALNLGMDSFVFIDDNPFERNLVKTLIPEITVPALPEDPAEYLRYIQNSNLFETISYSNEDRERTGQYQAEFKRKELEEKFETIDDYLRNLEMIGEVRKFEDMSCPRIAQLTQRSNQFNLRTVRYTEADIRAIAQSDEYIPLYYTLKDKFGEHGIVAVVIMKKESDKTLFIDTWLMSCRVLKRGMEEFVVNEFVKWAKESNYKQIKGEYIPTAKNGMVKEIYSTMGFTTTTENQYKLNIDDYKEKNTYIKGV